MKRRLVCFGLTAAVVLAVVGLTFLAADGTRSTIVDSQLAAAEAGWRAPSASITVSPSAINKGETATLTWATENAQSVMLDGKPVEASGTLDVSPQKTTTYTVVASRRLRSDTASVTLVVKEPEPQPPEPKPDPQPKPEPGKTLSAVGVWTALGAGSKLGTAAHSHDVAQLLKSQNGGWLVIDKLMAQDETHPAWVDQWLKVLADSGKTEPAVIWHDQGKVVAIDQCSANTDAETLLALAKSHLPESDEAVVVQGKVRPLGLKPRTVAPGKLMAEGAPVKQISAVLEPLAEKDYPTVDLGSQITQTKNQGNYGTCVSQAFCAALEAVRYSQFGPENDVELSPNNLATQIDGWNGAIATDAVKALMKTGVIPMADQPNYSSRLPVGWQKKAAGYKVLAIYDTPDSDYLGYLAAALSRGWLVPIGIGVGSGFDVDGEGYISYARGSGRGGHEILACGLKQHDGKWWIRIKNSWGQKWGNDGFAWIESTFLTRSVFADLWVVVVTSAAPTDKAVSPSIAQPRGPPAAIATVPVESVVAEPNLIAFTASWCVPCQQAKPRLLELQAQGVNVQIVDIDKEPGKATQYGVTSVPAYFIRTSNGMKRAASLSTAILAVKG